MMISGGPGGSANAARKAAGSERGMWVRPTMAMLTPVPSMPSR
jgi:hypothetical protein